MSPLASTLFACAASVVFALGAIHVLYTFRGAKLQPRDDALLERMRVISPKISRDTSMWRAWIGFNASHGFGAILFGAVYGYLAIAHGALLSQSGFLLALGLLLLVGYAVLGKLYWFSIPFRGIVLAASLYVAGLLVILS